MNQVIEVRVNGRTVSSYNTRGMIFGVARYISRMSRYVTLCARRHHLVRLRRADRAGAEGRRSRRGGERGDRRARQSGGLSA